MAWWPVLQQGWVRLGQGWAAAGPGGGHFCAQWQAQLQVVQRQVAVVAWTIWGLGLFWVSVQMLQRHTMG